MEWELITESMWGDVCQQNRELLTVLGLDDDWVARQSEDWNDQVRAAPNRDPTGNPLLGRLLLDRHDLTEVFPWAQKFGPSLLDLCKFIRELDDVTPKAWRRWCKDLAGRFDAFHSAVVELALRRYLASRPEIAVRFVDRTPGIGKTPDFELTWRRSTIRAEVKSIITEDSEPTPLIAADGMEPVPMARLLGPGFDPATVGAIVRRYLKPFIEMQLDVKTGPCAVFVDVSCCPDLRAIACAARMRPDLGILEQALAGVAGEQRRRTGQLGNIAPLFLVVLDTELAAVDLVLSV